MLFLPSMRVSSGWHFDWSVEILPLRLVVGVVVRAHSHIVKVSPVVCACNVFLWRWERRASLAVYVPVLAFGKIFDGHARFFGEGDEIAAGLAGQLDEVL